jgi:hypothetical protein
VFLSRDEVTGIGDLQGRLGPIDAEIVEGELSRLMKGIARADKSQRDHPFLRLSVGRRRWC